MSYYPSSLLALPDSALIAISDFLLPGGHSGGDSHSHGALSHDKCQAVTFASRSPDFLALSMCCKRLTELYRSRVTSLILRGRCAPVGCTRSWEWEIYPALVSVRLDFADRYNISDMRDHDTELASAAADLAWLRGMVPPTVRCLSLTGAALRVETFHLLLESCTALEALVMLDCRVVCFAAEPSGRPGEACPSPDRLSSWVVPKHIAQNMKTLKVDNSGPSRRPCYREMAYNVSPLDELWLPLEQLYALERLELSGLSLSKKSALGFY